jgi:ArsR family transcriptional regulator, arsenate/arsenite/antimonite-responsive transcriptional repressor
MGAAKDTRLNTMEEAFKAFADPTRLRILGLLAGGEICVCNIHESLGIPQPTASRHLAYLRRKGLVLTRKEGLWVHYTLAPLDDAVMRVLMSAVTHCLGHCDSITKDRQRLESQTGCCTPAMARSNLECCAAAPRAGERRRERRVDRRRRSL